MAPLTDGQEKLLALLPIAPAMLSLVCSLTILNIVYHHYREKGQTSVYHRLLVGMSLCDVFFSFWFPWSAFLMPADTSLRVWAIGTNGTCTFMGFMFNFGFIGLLYNTSLSYYFLLTARFGWRDKDIARCVEPTMHALVLLFPITCGLVFVALGVYAEQPIGLGCWVGDYPHGCGTEPGQEPCLTPILGWISAGIPVLFSFLSLLINNGLIYCHVRATIVRARRFSSHFLANSNSSRLSIHSRAPKPDAQARRLQSVAVQAGLYLLVFFLNYIWTMILRNVGADEKYWTSEHESDLFWLLVLQAIFLPLQGFFNLCVFSRPKYIRTRKQFPNQSRLWVFQRAMFGAGKAPLHAASTATATTNKNPTILSANLQPPVVEEPPTTKVDAKKVEKDGSDTDQNDNTKATTVSEPMDASFPERDTELEVKCSTTSHPPGRLQKSSALPVSSKRLLDLLGISSRRHGLDQSRDDYSSPFNESANRPLQRVEFDSFLLGCEDFSEFDDEGEESDAGVDALGGWTEQCA